MTSWPHGATWDSERRCWRYLQNVMKSFQVSSFWILDLWSKICFLRSPWLLTFWRQQSVLPSGCIQKFTHFTCKRHGGARRKSLSRESPNSHFIWSKGPCASRYVWGINWSSVICDSSVLKTLALMQLPLTWCPAHNTSQFISNKLWMIWICRN